MPIGSIAHKTCGRLVRNGIGPMDEGVLGRRKSSVSGAGPNYRLAIRSNTAHFYEVQRSDPVRDLLLSSDS